MSRGRINGREMVHGTRRTDGFAESIVIDVQTNDVEGWIDNWVSRWAALLRDAPQIDRTTVRQARELHNLTSANIKFAPRPNLNRAPQSKSSFVHTFEFATKN